MSSIKLTILSFIFLLCGFLSYSTAQWERIVNGMGNVTVFSLAGSGNNLFAGVYNNGVYKSTNYGVNWIHASLEYSVSSIAVNGNNMFAGSFLNNVNHGVHLSTDGGLNWTQTSFNNQDVYSLAVNGSYVFAGTYDHGVYFSTNNGATWSQTSLNNQWVRSLAISGINIFAGTYTGVYLSTNNGTTWSQTSLNNREVYSFAINSNYIFAGTNFGVYLSANNGTTWTQTSLNYPYVNSLAVYGNYVFAGASLGYGVFVSDNNGTSWVLRNEGFANNLTVNALCILNNYIFAGTASNTINGTYRRLLSDFTGIKPISEQIPSHYTLKQNYPNPFNPSTKIRFDIPDVGTGRPAVAGSLRVYDILGREVTTLVNEQLKPGTYEVNFDATNYPSGVYFYTLTAGEFSQTNKMILMK